MRQLLDLAQNLPKPRAVLIVSAHWEHAPTSPSAPATHTPPVHDFAGIQPRYRRAHYNTPDMSALACRDRENFPRVTLGDMCCAGVGSPMRLTRAGATLDPHLGLAPVPGRGAPRRPGSAAVAALTELTGTAPRVAQAAGVLTMHADPAHVPRALAAPGRGPGDRHRLRHDHHRS
ncbi:hypothetical protein [Streptomyces sp. NPDC059761]|uniref:hypothetical protein n=1 Tax=Streptomyces sp. NPDC059761 TaxID=3346937 RepID=UPI0036616634